MCKATSVSLTTPFCCNSAIQAVVRTNSDVQNGSSTTISSRFATRVETCASR